MKSSISAGLIFTVALIAGCAPKPPAPPDAVAIRNALTAQMAKVMPAFATKDVAAAAALFTEDATWILPDATTFRGRADIENGIKAFFAAYESVAPGTTTIDQLVVINDGEALTFAHGTYGMTMKGKKAENHTNPYADYWKKGADGVWRIAYEVNADGVVPDAVAKKP
jgi:uncharacterized protein (TIGR02246 family)